MDQSLRQETHEPETGEGLGVVQPSISVVMPAHDSEATIDTAVASVLDQTFSAFELIVIENGSTDRTPDLCDRWVGRDDRVRLHRLEFGDANRARNLGVELARGGLVAFLDSDDRFGERHLELAAQVAGAHPECQAFALGGVSIDYRGRRSRLSPRLPARRNKRLSFEDALRGGLYTGMTVIRTDTMRGIGGFRVGPAGGDDYDLWLRILGSGIEALYVASNQYEHWIHPVSRGSTRDEESWKRHVSALILALESSSDLALTEAQRSAVYRRTAKLARQRDAISSRRDLEERVIRGESRHARRHYVRARHGYRVRSRYLLGLVLMTISPRLFARVVAARRTAGFGLG